MSPLREFIFRGRNQGFAVYRFRQEFQKDVPATIKQVKTFLGRPYDARYRMDDEAIYCSELIYKAYKTATGQQLGQLVKLGDLNWSPYQETIKYYEAGPVPLNREMITPKEMAQASQLELVFAHAMKTYQSTHSSMTPLEHLSNWFAGSASWRTAFLLEKCVLHGHTVEQTALVPQ